MKHHPRVSQLHVYKLYDNAQCMLMCARDANCVSIAYNSVLA